MAIINDIIQRAVNFNPLNQGVQQVSTTDELISRIRADQTELYTGSADENRIYFTTTSAWTSSSGSANRTIALVNINPPVERLLQIQIGTGSFVPGGSVQIMSEVDVADQTAATGPCYIAQGQTLTEYASSWGPTTGTVSGTITYVQQAIDLDPAGATTQQISFPDRWNHILVQRLAMYFSQKDVQRDPGELQWLQALCDKSEQAFLAFMTHQSGVSVERVQISTPTANGNKS